ncbi:MAG: N-methyl-L-tryptophan oxidase [Pseudomonadota bacterium]
MNDYDLIVLGTGGMGSAALYSAAARGLRCLGLDRFPPAHDRGSSHGESRLIRLSYFEHADYVPLLRRSYELWDALDPALLHRSGLIYFGQENGAIIGGVLASANKHDLEVERVKAEMFPQYQFVDGLQAVFEPDAGWLPVERCVQMHLDAATSAGAEYRWGEAVLSWEKYADGIRVRTESNSYSARALVIASGPWAGDLLPDLALPLTVVRKHLHWFACDDDRYQHGFFYELPHGQFYGFPVSGGRIKIAEHTGGESVEDPLSACRDRCPEDDRRIAEFVAEFLPGVHQERLAHQTCFYTRTPDEHFVLDRHPQADNVAIVAGLSGHGFKFAPAIGEVLVDLATTSATPDEISFLSLQRFRDTG